MTTVMTLERLVDHVQLFFLVLLRVGALFVEMPFLGSNLIPVRVRTGLAACIALAVFPPVQAAGYAYAGGDAWALAWAALNEVAIGLALGFLANLYLMAFQLAGQFAANQMGLSFIEVVDPMAEISVPIIGQLQGLFATLIFIAIDGHRFLLDAVVRSFTVCPALSLGTAGGMLTQVAGSLGMLFELAFIIAAPVVGTVFVVDIALCLLGRAAPQLNIMMLGFPVKIIFGMLVLITIVPPLGLATEKVFALLFRDAGRFLMVAGG